MSSIAGTATGWLDGQRFATGYAMWLLWSALSSECPSQQLGKRTWSRSIVRRPAGHVGTVLVGWTSPSTPQFQYVIPRLCGVVAMASPATIFRPLGNGRTAASVLRR